jgi:hypothetical protein
MLQLEKKDLTSIELPAGPSNSVAERDVIGFNEHLWIHRQFMPDPNHGQLAQSFLVNE